jgi:hypothetical protein
MPDDFKNKEINHVYILGAGFSRPMGGPLFTELLDLPLRYDIRNFENHNSGSVLQLVNTVRDIHYFYRWLLQERMVLNAEHFLEMCDCALDGKESWLIQSFPGQFRSLTQWNNNSKTPMPQIDLFRFFLKATRIRLAVETNSFIEQVPEMNDRWQPYIRWFPGLGKTDTIITLNYDLLVETVAAKVNRPFPGREFETKEDLVSVDELMRQNEDHPDQPLLCKLHGSVDFIENDSTAYAKRYNIDDYFEADPPLLGTPGTGKVSLSNGSLERVWLTALERLRDAHVISVVGYSLPETDNDFRIKLLDSVAANNGNLKAINIVLGQPTPHSQRARAILEQATRLYSPVGERPTVNLLPIYAQDYLPYYRPSDEAEIHEHAFPRC